MVQETLLTDVLGYVRTRVVPSFEPLLLLVVVVKVPFIVFRTAVRHQSKNHVGFERRFNCPFREEFVQEIVHRWYGESGFARDKRFDTTGVFRRGASVAAVIFFFGNRGYGVGGGVFSRHCVAERITLMTFNWGKKTG